MRKCVGDGGKDSTTQQKLVLLRNRSTRFLFLGSLFRFLFLGSLFLQTVVFLFLQSAKGFVCVGQTHVCSFLYVDVKRCYTAQVEKKQTPVRLSSL